jgi:hypothetical protein
MEKVRCSHFSDVESFDTKAAFIAHIPQKRATRVLILVS